MDVEPNFCKSLDGLPVPELARHIAFPILAPAHLYSPVSQYVLEAFCEVLGAPGEDPGLHEAGSAERRASQAE
jgi:hypothetical protein